MSNGNLGGASFTVSADTLPFEAGMKRAQATAKRASQTIERDIGSLASRGKAKLKELGDEVDRTTGKLKDKGTRAANGLYAIGAAIDDMQYGFRGVVNNVPEVVRMFGFGSGIAGGAQIAAVAVNQLVQHWGEMTDALQSSWLNVPAEHLAKLRIQAEKATDAFGKLMQSPSKFEARQISAMTEAMTEGAGGAAAVVKGVRGSIAAGVVPGLKVEPTPDQAQRLKDLDEREKMWRDAAKAGRIPAKELPMRLKMVDELRRKITAEIDAALEEATRQLIGKSLLPGAEGADARATLRRMLEKNPNAFTEDFRKRMAATTDQSVLHHDANARMAQALMRGPFGTQMRMGLGEERFFGGGRAMEDRQIRSLLRDNTRHIRLGGGEEAGMFRKMKEAGLSLEEGRAVMGGMRTKDVAEFARTNNLQMWQAVPRMFDERLNEVTGRRGKPIPNAMEKGLRRLIKDTGIEADAPGVLREAREINKKEIQNTMLQHGLSKGQAEQFLLHQRQQQLMGAARGGQWVGLTQFASMTPEARLPDLAKKQLDELTEIRKALKERNAMADQAKAAALAALPMVGGLPAAIAGGPG